MTAAAAGSKGRGKGWRALEEQDMLTCVADIVPVDTGEWDDVAIAFNFHRQKGDRRDMAAIKRKFKVLCTLTPASAGLTSREHIAQAKRIQSDIERKKASLRADNTTQPHDVAAPADAGTLSIPDDPLQAQNAINAPNTASGTIPPPPASTAASPANPSMLRPAQLAALGRTISVASKRPSVPPTRRQVMDAMRILHPIAVQDVDGGTASARSEDSASENDHGNLHPSDRSAAAARSARRHRSPKRRRTGGVDADPPSIMSMLWMLEQSREQWLRQMEERREMWEKEREDRRIEREQRERERDEYRAQIEARREERAAKLDQVLTLVLAKLAGQESASGGAGPSRT